jgi:hypothetical protein
MKLISIKLLIIILAIFSFSFCSKKNPCEIDIIEDSSFVSVRRYLIKNDFYGTIVFKDYGYEVFRSDKQVSIPLKEVDFLMSLKIAGIVNEKPFSYFVQDGWKGTSKGLLYVEQENFNKNGFENVKYLKKSNYGGSWYCVSSKIY